MPASITSNVGPRFNISEMPISSSQTFVFLGLMYDLSGDLSEYCTISSNYFQLMSNNGDNANVFCIGI